MSELITTTPDAYSRDGHPVKIVRSYFEDGIEFAVIRYLDGHEPGPVGGRVAGTEEEPLWEHRVKDGRVVKSGGDYWNDEDWTVERGLQPVPHTRKLVAELELLTMYDSMREARGHDYGGGQRRAELQRRRLFLRERGLEGETPTGPELVEAFERVGRPRLERLATEGYRANTPATFRTRMTWQAIERRIRALASTTKEDSAMSTTPALHFSPANQLLDELRELGASIHEGTPAWAQTPKWNARGGQLWLVSSSGSRLLTVDFDAELVTVPSWKVERDGVPATMPLPEGWAALYRGSLFLADGSAQDPAAFEAASAAWVRGLESQLRASGRTEAQVENVTGAVRAYGRRS